MLPSVDDCKAYLRIEHADEDALLAQLLAEAIVVVRQYLGRPITTAARSFHELPAYLVDLRWVVFLPESPVAAAGLEVTDVAGAVVDPATYRLDGDRGMLIAKPGQSLTNGPYDVSCSVGLATRADYATDVEPSLRTAIVDLVADKYQRRSPLATSEKEGDLGAGYDTARAMPSRAAAALDPFRLSVRIG